MCKLPIVKKPTRPYALQKLQTQPFAALNSSMPELNNRVGHLPINPSPVWAMRFIVMACRTRHHNCCACFGLSDISFNPKINMRMETFVNRTHFVYRIRFS